MPTKKDKKYKKKKQPRVHGNLEINVDKKQMMNQNELQSNKLFAKFCIFAGFFCIVCLVLNEIGLFKIDPIIVRVVCIAASALLLIPFIIVYIARQRKSWIKYLLIIDISAVVLMVYSVFSYHAIILLPLPLIASMVYFDKKLLNITTLLSLVVIVLSSYFACVLLYLPDDPLRTVEAAMAYGALPKCIIFIAIAYVARQVTKKAYRMLSSSADNSAEVGRMTSGIQLVMKQTQTLMGTRDLKTLASLIANCLSDVLMSMLNLTEAPSGTVGVLIGDQFYTVNSIGSPNNICRDLGGDIGFEFNNARFKFSKYVRDASSVAEVREGFITLKFYNKGHLTGFVVYKQDVDADDYSLREVIDVFNTNTTSIIDNTMLTYDMFRTQEQLAYSLAIVSESASQETGQHIRRVSEYARVMGKYICDSDEQLETFRIAAMLHDIGKMMIPKEIIEKPGRLTAEEFGIMKKHVVYGHDMIAHAPGEVMDMARNVILHHHERWDGTGYLGISGEDIDKFARYVSVCDVFDALLSRRCYKEAWPAQKVYEEITSQSGRQFDPAAVETFKKCYIDMLKIRDEFPDNDSEEENIVSDESISVVPASEQQAEAEKRAKEAEAKRNRQLPQIKVDPSIVTPISI